MPEKYEREIEEILSRSGEPPTQRDSFPSPRRRSLGGSLRLRGVTSRGRLMLISFALIVAALFLQRALPWVGSFIALGAIVLFLVAYSLAFVRPRRRYEKRWRGRIIELPSERNRWQEFLHRWFR